MRDWKRLYIQLAIVLLLVALVDFQPKQKFGNVFVLDRAA